MSDGRIWRRIVFAEPVTFLENDTLRIDHDPDGNVFAYKNNEPIEIKEVQYP